MLRKLSILTVCVLTLAAGSANAEEEATKRWRVDTALSLYSDYMFRGFNLYPGASIQPSITGVYDSDFGSFSANLWMHLSGDGDSAEGVDSFTEIDETIRYTYTLDDFSFSAGLAWYTYPDSDDDIDATVEALGAITYASYLNPTLTVFHDFDEFDAQYYELSLSHGFEITDGGTLLTPAIGVGFASNAEKVYANDGLVQTTSGLSLTIPLENFLFIPSANYTFESDSLAVNEFWFGTTLLYSY